VSIGSILPLTAGLTFFISTSLSASEDSSSEFETVFFGVIGFGGSSSSSSDEEEESTGGACFLGRGAFVGAVGLTAETTLASLSSSDDSSELEAAFLGAVGFGPSSSSDEDDESESEEEATAGFLGEAAFLEAAGLTAGVTLTSLSEEEDSSSEIGTAFFGVIACAFGRSSSSDDESESEEESTAGFFWGGGGAFAGLAGLTGALPGFGTLGAVPLAFLSVFLSDLAIAKKMGGPGNF